MTDENIQNTNDENTPNTNDENAQNTSEIDDRIEKVARTYRHIGYAFFGGLAFVVAMFLLYSAITAIHNDTVIDPQTGKPFYGATADNK